jgi:hypothetical protein
MASWYDQHMKTTVHDDDNEGKGMKGERSSGGTGGTPGSAATSASTRRSGASSKSTAPVITPGGDESRRKFYHAVVQHYGFALVFITPLYSPFN